MTRYANKFPARKVWVVCNIFFQKMYIRCVRLSVQPEYLLNEIEPQLLYVRGFLFTRNIVFQPSVSNIIKTDLFSKIDCAIHLHLQISLLNPKVLSVQSDSRQSRAVDQY